MTSLRFTIWWLLKSPWAKKFGWVKTIGLGLSSVFIRKKHPSKIVVCVACSNRMEQVKEVFFPSIQKMNSVEQLEIVMVCDGKEEFLIREIAKELKIDNLKIISSSEPFSRSLYLNHALENAGNGNVFITDVDVELPENFTDLFHKYVQLNTAWFPVCELLNKKGKIEGQYPEGVGLVGFVNSNNLRLDENITTWGNEDWQFLYELFNCNIYPKRTQKNRFLHYFHEPADKENYKKSW